MNSLFVKVVVYLLIGISIVLLFSTSVFTSAGALVVGLGLSERVAFAISTAAVGCIALAIGWWLDEDIWNSLS